MLCLQKMNGNNKEEDEDDVILPEIPTSLLFDEILPRLTVKDLCKFKCVSKFWSKSLSHPYFLTLHRCRSDQNPPSRFLVSVPFDCPLYRDLLKQESEVSLHMTTADHEARRIVEFTKQVKVHEYPYLILLPSHEQLVCLSTTNHIYICNPSTQDFIELPEGSPLPLCLHHVGFGYLPSSMVYKVVRLFYRHLDPDPVNHRLGCEVLTISSLNNSYSWRVMEEDCPHAVEEYASVMVNGFVIWQVDEFLIFSEEEDDEYIVCFNLETEKFGFVRPPSSCLKVEYGFRLAELKGNLWYVDYGDGPLIMNMWILKDWNAFEWVKQYSISFGVPMGWFRRMPFDIFQQRGDDNGEVILIYARGSLQYYNVGSKTFSPFVYGVYGVDHKFCFYHDRFM